MQTRVRNLSDWKLNLQDDEHSPSLDIATPNEIWAYTTLVLVSEHPQIDKLEIQVTSLRNIYEIWICKSPWCAYFDQHCDRLDFSLFSMLGYVNSCPEDADQ